MTFTERPRHGGVVSRPGHQVPTQCIVPSDRPSRIGDRSSARLTAVTERPLDAVPYAAGATDAQLRFLGPVDGKRVLVLGARDATAAAVFDREGAHVLVVEPDRTRIQRAQAATDGAGIEWHEVDHAELAFTRADTIDLAFTAGVLDEIEDFPRVLRQVHRVLRPHGTFLLAYEHPLARVLDGAQLARAWNDTKPVDADREGAAVTLFPRTPSDVFVALIRAGFRVDALGEPVRAGEQVPAAIVFRARKEGA